MSDVLDSIWDSAVGKYQWLKSLVLGEFSENRAFSVVVTDMLAGFIPGVVVVTSARDLAAVCLRLGKRYDNQLSAGQLAAHPEWEEWALLVACAIGVFGPLICAAIGTAGTLVGTAAGFVIGDEAAAFVRALCLLLIRGAKSTIHGIIAFLSKFIKGDISKLLRAVRFADFGAQLVKYVVEFIAGTRRILLNVRTRLSSLEYFDRAKTLLIRLEEMERQFYAVQTHCAEQIPRALAKLDEALKKILPVEPHSVHYPVVPQVPAPKPVTTAPVKVRITSGVGETPRPLHGHASLPEGSPQTLHSANIHEVDPKKLTNTKKGIFGEVVSDQYMTGKGHTNVMLPGRQPPRSMEDIPIGRGIDGVYKNGHPPPPYIITETKYRTGGNFDAKRLPTTKGSPGHASAKQMSKEWITDRLTAAVGRETERKIVKAGYEQWLMVVDETGKVVDITKLNAKANAIGKIAS